jgi:hypothetical protein
MLSPARIAPYRSFFECATDDQVVGAYFWGQAVAGAFQPSLSIYEIALRNSIHLAASLYFSKGSSTSHPWYDYSRDDAVLFKNATTKAKIDEVLRDAAGTYRSPQPSPDSVIASLSFGFWPSFLDGLSRPEKAQIFTNAFPHHPKSKPKHWSFPDNTDEVLEKLFSIRDLRNSVAHHEPIWKAHRLSGTEKKWWNSVQSLRDKHADLLEVMTWCSPVAVATVEQSYAARFFRGICSTQAVQAYKNAPFDAGQLQLFAPLAAVTTATPLPVALPTGA